MTDYDLPMMESDVKDLRNKGLLNVDRDGHDFVKYRDLLKQVLPKSAMNNDINYVTNMVIKVQAHWRGYMARKQYLKLKETDLRQVGRSFNHVSSKGVSFKENAGPVKKATTLDDRKAEAEKKKKELIKQTKQKKKAGETLEAKVNAVVKPGKDKVSDKQQKLREELSKYIKEVLIEEMITAAQCFGESLLVGRSIQANFETRPVTKFVFPMIQEF